MLALVLIVAAVAGALRLRAGLKPQLPLKFLPVVVYAPIRLDGALVLGASRDWHVNRDTPLRFGDPVPVSLTAYCLKGMTRRDHYVREGIIAVGSARCSHSAGISRSTSARRTTAAS